MKKRVIQILISLCFIEFMVLVFQFGSRYIDNRAYEEVRQEILRDMQTKHLHTSRIFREIGSPHGDNIQIWQLSTQGKFAFLDKLKMKQVSYDEIAGVEEMSIFHKLDDTQLDYNKNFDVKAFLYTYNELKKEATTLYYRYQRSGVDSYYLVNPALKFGLLLRVEY